MKVRLSSIETARRLFDTRGIDSVEGREVEVQLKPRLTSVLSLRLSEERFKELARAARAQGIGATTLARVLIEEGLDRRLASPAASGPDIRVAEKRRAYGAMSRRDIESAADAARAAVIATLAAPSQPDRVPSPATAPTGGKTDQRRRP
jgi:hypothetical protein